MDPQGQFCPNEACLARGTVGKGNIGVHHRAEGRYICHTCGKTFAATRGTPFYRRRSPAEFISDVVSLVAHGCPLQAIVATWHMDERTVADWVEAAGAHCQSVHEATVQRGGLDLVQAQCDELRVKLQAGIVWLALAIAVPTRLWLGAALSPSRDDALLRALADQVKACALCRPLLVCFDGCAGYVKAFRSAFRTPLRSGQRGRPRLIAWPDLVLGQVVKQYAKRRVVGIDRRIIQGASLVTTLVQRSQGAGVLNTAFIERLNATWREHLACLARRSRSLARTRSTLLVRTFLLGTVYNFCIEHDSLRLPLYVGSRGHRRWVHRTPAMAAGLTDHCWSVLELLSFKIPPDPYVPPKRRGRPPRAATAVALA
jgi:hypothetical protein